MPATRMSQDLEAPAKGMQVTLGGLGVRGCCFHFVAARIDLKFQKFTPGFTDPGLEKSSIWL